MAWLQPCALDLVTGRQWSIVAITCRLAREFELCFYSFFTVTWSESYCLYVWMKLSKPSSMSSSHKKGGSSSSSRKVNTCTNCGRASRGHVGPQGSRCTMNVTPSRKEHVKPLDFDGESEHSGSDNAALLELSNQMGKMAISMEKLQTDVNLLKVNKPAGAAAIPALKSSDSITESKAAADSYECLASGAKVSLKVLKSAKSGECINLVDFAPVLEPTNTTETSLVDGELVFRPKRAMRSMDSFLLWSLAWRGY
jgi:hypothetical protein